MGRDDSRQGSSGLSTLVLATALGVGVGLLAAPQAGPETRRALRKRLADARDGVEEGFDDLEERTRPARKAVRNRAEDLARLSRKRYEEGRAKLEDYQEDLEDHFDDDDDEGSGLVGTLLTVGAGLAAAAYFMTSERAAPARERVREAAATVRDEAESRYDRFQEKRRNGQTGTGSGAGPADSAPFTS